MAELFIARSSDGSRLVLQVGEHCADVDWAGVALTDTVGARIVNAAAGYGRELWDRTIGASPGLAGALADLPVGERLLLVAADPLAALIPWEYLRLPGGALLAGRVNLARGLPAEQRRDMRPLQSPLHALAVVASPVDDERKLNTEREWDNLARIARQSGRAFQLTRVRPPELSRLERALDPACDNLVWFMGHSDSQHGRSALCFEDARGRAMLVDPVTLANGLDASVFLVVLNSCRSAVAWDWNAFGNIARGLIQRGLPYALGMQFVVPDAAAVALSEALFEFLLKGRDIEDAVRRMRRALEGNTALPQPAWLAGIPALYTSLRDPLPAIALSSGAPAVAPAPELLAARTDLSALAEAPHFVGRATEISQALEALLEAKPADFVVLHGLGGVGKTALARAVAERIGWYFDDRVLAVSFETFTRLDEQDRLVVDPQFADGFIFRLAQFYGLDTEKYLDPVRLQEAVLQQRRHKRSLLVLDNLETLLDSPNEKDYGCLVTRLVPFISRLKEGEGVVLIISRSLISEAWGTSKTITVGGLDDEAGAELFMRLISELHRTNAPIHERRYLSRRVKGHPLSIRLLAARFPGAGESLAHFLEHIESELTKAEQDALVNIADPHRQVTLYACLAYSVNRLTEHEKRALMCASLITVPFIKETFAIALGVDVDGIASHLARLISLGLLDVYQRAFVNGPLLRFEMHPVVRWYTLRYVITWQDRNQLLPRIARAFEYLANSVYEDIKVDERVRVLFQDSLSQLDTLMPSLALTIQGGLAQSFAQPLLLLSDSYITGAPETSINARITDIRDLAVAQSKIAAVLLQNGEVTVAIRLLSESSKLAAYLCNGEEME